MRAAISNIYLLAAFLLSLLEGNSSQGSLESMHSLFYSFLKYLYSLCATH